MEAQRRHQAKSAAARQGLEVLKKLVALVSTKELEKMLEFGPSDIISSDNQLDQASSVTTENPVVSLKVPMLREPRDVSTSLQIWSIWILS
jgi:hypothetical protein